MKTSPKQTALSPRAFAAKLIVAVLDQGKSLSSLLPEVQNQVKAQDFPLLQEITFGICRVLPRLEQIIKRLVDRPLKGKTRIVHCLLLVGLYQLLYTRIPAHAALNEVVNASKSLQVDSFRALINGVLRRFLREQNDILAQVDKHWQTLHPEWLVNKLKQSYPNWREIIEANNQKPPMWLRINQQKTDVETYRTLLQQQGIEAHLTDHPDALCLSTPCSVAQLPHFAQGWVTVQDKHAQWAAILLDAQNGEYILDACAAPGGKTTHILERAPQAKVIALDIEKNRLQRVQENLQRLNQQADIICGDASQPDQWIASALQFDKILLDAPCSATGVIRRHPDIKWLRQPSDIAQLVQLQQQILTALWQKLKPNGVLVYATCSILPEENDLQIANFIRNTPNAILEPFNLNSTIYQTRQFLPSPQSGDGFYYAKLRKQNDV